MSKSITVITREQEEITFPMADDKPDGDIISIARSLDKNKRAIWGWADDDVFYVIPYGQITRMEIDGIDPANTY